MSKKTIIQLETRIAELEKEVDESRKSNGLPASDRHGIIGSDLAVTESEEKFRSLFNGINLPVFVHTLKSEGFNRFIEVNDIACRNYGFTRGEFLEMSPMDISSKEDVDQAGAVAGRRKLATEGQAVFEATHITREGRKFPVEICSNIYNWLGRKVILSVAMDISVRKEGEKALRDSEEKYRHLIEDSSDAIYVFYDGRFEVINKKFTDLFGITAQQANAPGFDFMTLVHPESRAEFVGRDLQEFRDRKLDHKYEFSAWGADERQILVEASVTYIRYKQGVAAQCIMRDITEKRNLEEQLQQAQKMESIGLLAGGVAHDFNNLLTVINGYAEMALTGIPEADPVYKDICEIKKAGDRAEILTRQLLAFSRKQIYKTEILEINDVIGELDQMLGRLIGENIRIQTVLAEGLPRIKADKAQLGQVFMNLVVNSRDAVNEVSRPDFNKKITIETGLVTLDREYVSKHPESVEGPHVFISVSDNGVGMDREGKRRIFEPFYTTKEKSRGTGLGLPTVYGIVKQNHGSVYVYSEPGAGTTFRIYWPITEETAVAPVALRPTEGLSGTESILLVEDDPLVRRFALDALASFGYSVCSAKNGKLALEAIDEQAGGFDLVITDLIMPELNGKEFAEKAMETHPDLKVIFVSGYTDNHIVHDGLLEDGINFIHKPFSVRALVGIVREVLDRD